jgi:hypothetical protein
MISLLCRTGICAIIVLVLALEVVEAGARPAASAGGRAGAAPARSFSAPRIGGIGGRAFSGPHLGRPSVSARLGGRLSHSPAVHGVSGKLSPTSRFSGASAPRFATAATLAHPGRLNGQGGAWNRRSITNAAFRSSFVRPRTFAGRFRGSYWPWWTGGIVVGWLGPVFWPYAYDDFFDYVFWPYVYDDFWPYAYEDVYYGIYGGFAYVDPALKPAVYRSASADSARAAGVCGENAPELTSWPIERIAEVIEPSETQRATLDELKASTARAIDILRSACPNQLPSIPTGRLEAMESRLQVMLEAVRTVRIPLDRLYRSLGDEQKARFNAVAPNNAANGKKEQRDLARLCTRHGTQLVGLPIKRIEDAVRPTDEQQSAFAELKDAAARASERLKGSCPAYEALTPTGRVEAMEQRLEVLLGAGKMVEPALANFYNSLSDEQKARFNTLGSTQRRA